MAVRYVPTGRGGWNKGLRLPPEVLTLEEVDRLAAAAGRRSSTGIRARALILVLHRGGLRISEALALYPKDIDLDQGVVRVLRGKGSKPRSVVIDAGACAAVERWLERRRQLPLTGRHPLFCTLAGKPLAAQQARTMLKRLARRAGIEKRVHPHGLRHAHAAHLCRSQVPVAFIQRQLGHSNLAITTRYLQSIDNSEVVDALQGVSWVTPHDEAIAQLQEARTIERQAREALKAAQEATRLAMEALRDSQGTKESSPVFVSSLVPKKR